MLSAVAVTLDILSPSLMTIPECNRTFTGTLQWEYMGADKSLTRPDWKNNWKVAIFHPTRRSLLPWRPGWKDNLLNFFSGACKSQSLVAVACFIPGRAKDLSAPRYSFAFKLQTRRSGYSLVFTVWLFLLQLTEGSRTADITPIVPNTHHSSLTLI